MCAILSGLAVTSYMRSAVDTTTVYVAARDLPPGTVLSEGDLTALEVPTGGIPSGAVLDPKTVMGRRLMTALIQGDYVRNGHLTDEEGDVSAQLAKVGPDYRAIMLPEEILPSMDRLNKGDFIELTVVMPIKTKTEQTQMAIQVTYGTVLDVLMKEDDPIGLLLAVKEEDVPRIALALRSGTVTAAFVPTGVTPDPNKVQRVPLEVLTGEQALDTGAQSEGNASTTTSPATSPKNQ